MEKENLKKFIRTSLEKGYNKQDIKEALLEAGERLSDIEQAFQELEQVPSLISSPKSETETQKGETVIPREPDVSSPPSVFKERNQKQSLMGKIFKRFSVPKKLAVSILIVVIFALTAGATFYIYKRLSAINPLSFIPRDSQFCLSVNLDPQSQQVKNFKFLLQKFPGYNLFVNKINDFLNELKKDNLIPENLDLNIAKKITFAIGPVSSQTIEQILHRTSNPPFIIVFSNLDLKKASEWEKFLEPTTTKGQKENSTIMKYRGKTVIRYFGETNKSGQIIIGEMDIIAIRKNLILTGREDTAKEIIDSYLDHKNILSLPAYRKLRAKIVKPYLATGYLSGDLLGTGKVLGVGNMVKNSNGLLSASLASILDFLEPRIKTSGTELKNIIMFVINADSEGLTLKSYYLSQETKSSFSLKTSLFSEMPQKIGKLDVIYYSERKNLKSQIEKILNASTTYSEVYRNNLQGLNQIFGVDLEKDFFPFFQGNYAFFVASEPSGSENPIFGFMAQVNDEKKVREILSKIDTLRIALFLPRGMSINFAIKNKILFFTLGGDKLVDVADDYFGDNFKIKKLEYFNDLFINAPKTICEINYAYPYGYLGLIKYILGKFGNIYSLPILQVSGQGNYSSPNIIQPLPSSSTSDEFIDRGVGPYLKMLRLGGSYTYQTKGGLTVRESKIFIEPLSSQEKKNCEDFWRNWFLERKDNMLPLNK